MSNSLQQDMPWLDAASNDEVKRVVEALYRVDALTAAITDLDGLLLRISEESRQVARAEAASVMLYDPATEELFFQVTLGDSGDQETLRREIRLKLDQGIAGTAARTREPVSVADAQSDPRFFRDADAKSNFITRNLLAVPMVDRENLIGVLEVVNKSGGGTFSDLDLRVLEMFSSRAATAVVNARLIEDLVASERMAAVGQAVTGLSHYTKNIVTGLSGSLELIEMGLDANNFDVLKRAFPIFKRSTKRINNFVQDMLSFSKPRQPMREPCRFEELVDEAIETFADLASVRSVEVEKRITLSNAAVYLDAQGIYRCLLNLIGNASDAVPKEGGRIVLEASHGAAGTIEVTITDNGPGVPDNVRQKIFDPFFSTKGSRGTGLGLAVTAKIIREHGGTIIVEDAPGGGACFRITLPDSSELTAEEHTAS